jgi:predicted SAM-dependent methyltransferase
MTLKQAVGGILDIRIRSAAKGLYDQWRVLRNHRQGVRYVKKLCSCHGSLRVQFGCGPQPRKGWLNTDIWPGPWSKPDICLDASRPFPFDSASVAEIYSEHLFEHLDYPVGVRLFLSECFRVLESGATMTVGVPDLDRIYERYRNGWRPSLDGNRERYILGHPLEELNYCFHQGGEHKFLYNEEFLAALLMHFGFLSVKRREFDADMDTESRKDGTLYLVATKPTSSA